MFKRALAVFLPIVLALFITSVASAQDAKKEPAKEPMKKEMKQEMKKDAKAEMKTNLYSVECTPDCGFMARSENKKELTDIVIKHAHDIHGKDMAAADVEKMIKTKTRAEGMKGTKE